MNVEKEFEILLVEDDPNDAELSIDALRLHNLDGRVFLIRDGAEALDCIADIGSETSLTSLRTIKLIILDLKLTRVSGLEILKKARSLDRTKLIPVVILSSSAEEDDVLQCYQFGANSYIVKPVDFDKYMETVASLGYYWIIQNHPAYSVSTSPKNHGAAA
jgi:two-component system, response regulator